MKLVVLDMANLINFFHNHFFKHSNVPSHENMGLETST